MILAVALSPLALSVISAEGNATLAWYASPVEWPRFDPIVAIALLPLLAPLARRTTVPARAEPATAAPDPVVAAVTT